MAGTATSLSVEIVLDVTGEGLQATQFAFGDDTVVDIDKVIVSFQRGGVYAYARGLTVDKERSIYGTHRVLAMLTDKHIATVARAYHEAVQHARNLGVVVLLKTLQDAATTEEK